MRMILRHSIHSLEYRAPMRGWCVATAIALRGAPADIEVHPLPGIASAGVPVFVNSVMAPRVL